MSLLLSSSLPLVVVVVVVVDSVEDFSASVGLFIQSSTAWLLGKRSRVVFGGDVGCNRKRTMYCETQTETLSETVQFLAPLALLTKGSL